MRPGSIDRGLMTAAYSPAAVMRPGSMDRGLMSCARAVTADTIGRAMKINSLCGTIREILRGVRLEITSGCEVCHYQRAKLLACRARAGESVCLLCQSLLEKIAHESPVSERRCSSDVRIEHFLPD